MQLADLLIHGALVVGESASYRKDFDFTAPALKLAFAEENIVPSETASLLPWLVNHYT
jgi:hypothetical protein